MILYLDTSALVKLYVEENGSAEVRTAAKSADVLATHLLAFVELNGGISRMERERRLSAAQASRVKRKFAANWPSYLRIGLDQPLMDRAVHMARAFGLRAYDSVHLASADHLLKHAEGPVAFACFDRKLNQAAEVLGLALIA